MPVEPRGAQSRSTVPAADSGDSPLPDAAPAGPMPAMSQSQPNDEGPKAGEPPEEDQRVQMFVTLGVPLESGECRRPPRSVQRVNPIMQDHARESGESRRPPWSVPAIIGFIASLLVVPFVMQLLGLILGIVGIVQTSGRRKRGRKLSIAAVCISVLVCIGWVYAAAILFKGMAETIDDSRTQMQALLAAPDDTLPQVAEDVRENLFSARLRAVVKTEDLTAYVQEITQTHGKLTALKRSHKPVPPMEARGVVPLSLVGEFEGGEKLDVLLMIAFEGRSARVDNIVVGEMSLVLVR